MSDQRIIIPYKPREAFREYHKADQRFSITIAHRRAGKTVARINKLIKKAVQCDKPNPRFRYIAPFYVQAKDIAWLYLKHYAGPLIDLGGSINESELSVTLPHNNAVIRLYGADNAERMRGTYSDGDVLDEAQGIRKSVLTQIILPSLADRGGWLDISGTPKGWANLLGECYKMAKNDPDWYVQVLRASETGILPEDELDRQRSLMSENEYEQEFECSFDAAISGAVYGKWIADADKAGRITDRVKYDPLYPVYTAWDLGFDDATAIWFYQIGNGELYFIDYYENNGEGIGHYCEVLKQKDYRYHDFHFVPHDAAHKVMAAGGRSIVEQAKELGCSMSVIPAVSQQNSIEAARMTLPRCWFASGTENGVDALRNYHYQFDEDKKTYRSKPVHDWSSHGCNAFELAARVWKEKVVSVKEMDDRDLVNTFHRLRRENNLDKGDPYRVKPMRKKR